MSAAPVEPEFAVTEPGVYDGVPEDVYHADPVPGGSLSSSGARRLLPPSCPAIFRYEQLHGRPNKREFDFGHAAHAAVLGIGADVVEVKADDWRTNAAKGARDAAYAEGKTPLLSREVSQVAAMAAAIRAHPLASALLDPERGGKPEQSIFWHQQVPISTPDGTREVQVWRRSRLDWLPKLSASGRLLLTDYKTANSAEPRAFAKAVFDRGYHQQAPFYIDAVKAAGLAEDIAFVFIAQEKTPPYPVTVCELDVDALRIGQILNFQALGIYAQCRAEDRWPSYSDQVELLSPPPWVLKEWRDSL